MTNDEHNCQTCSSPHCDGLKNCDSCGEDTNCNEKLCRSCREQEYIDTHDFGTQQ